MTEASFEGGVTHARAEHIVPGREIHVQDLRGRSFCEISLITDGRGDSPIANIWNTTGASDPTAEQLDALDAHAIARENGAVHVLLDGPRQWVIDEITVWEAGEDKTFGGITGTWLGAADAGTTANPAIQDSYRPEYVYRNNSLMFRGGRPVYVLDAPDGEAFVMQSFTRHWDPGLSEDNLAHLGGRLDLPAGWGFRVEVLDRDMEVSTAGHDGLAHLVRDNVHNVYQGSDVGRAFSDICRQDSLW
jgi:hypothetical protein